MKKLNRSQKNILALIVPILLITIAMPISHSIGHFNTPARTRANPNPGPIDDWDYIFNLDQNWWVWIIVIIAIGVIELVLFSKD